MTPAEAFAVLDIPPAAAEAEIDAAYKAAVQAWHPDRFARTPHMQAIAEAKLKRLNEAYSLLSDSPATIPPPPASPQPAAPQPIGDRFDDRVLYQGFDPRLRLVGQNEPAGRPAETHLLDHELVLVTRRAVVFTRVTEYPYESILRVTHDAVRWNSQDTSVVEPAAHAIDRRMCVLEVAVPDGPQRRARVSLVFRDDRFAVRFARLLVQQLQNVRRTPPPTPRPHPREDSARPRAARTSPTRAADDRRLGQSLGLLAMLGVFLAGLAAVAMLPLPLSDATPGPTIPLAAEPDLFVWTEPAAPKPGQPYEIGIRLQLPPGTLPPDDTYSPAQDLLLFVTASDGTTGFETFKYVPPVAAPGGMVEIRVPALILDVDSHLGETLEVYSRLLGRWRTLSVREPRPAPRPSTASHPEV